MIKTNPNHHFNPYVYTLSLIHTSHQLIILVPTLSWCLCLCFGNILHPEMCLLLCNSQWNFTIYFLYFPNIYFLHTLLTLASNRRTIEFLLSSSFTQPVSTSNISSVIEIGSKVTAPLVTSYPLPPLPNFLFLTRTTLFRSTALSPPTHPCPLAFSPEVKGDETWPFISPLTTN